MDANAAAAREHHRASEAAAAAAARHREARDAAVRRLRAQDPSRWSYGALAGLLGVSKSRVRQILHG